MGPRAAAELPWPRGARAKLPTESRRSFRTATTFLVANIKFECACHFEKSRAGGPRPSQAPHVRLKDSRSQQPPRSVAPGPPCGTRARKRRGGGALQKKQGSPEKNLHGSSISVVRLLVLMRPCARGERDNDMKRTTTSKCQKATASEVPNLPYLNPCGTIFQSKRSAIDSIRAASRWITRSLLRSILQVIQRTINAHA